MYKIDKLIIDFLNSCAIESTLTKHFYIGDYVLVFDSMTIPLLYKVNNYPNGGSYCHWDIVNSKHHEINREEITRILQKYPNDDLVYWIEEQVLLNV
jgi:hypothetical protein